MVGENSGKALHALIQKKQIPQHPEGLLPARLQRESSPGTMNTGAAQARDRQAEERSSSADLRETCPPVDAGPVFDGAPAVQLLSNLMKERTRPAVNDIGGVPALLSKTRSQRPTRIGQPCDQRAINHGFPLQAASSRLSYVRGFKPN